MKILVIGDSIGLPHFHCTRDEVEVAYEEVYPEKLRRLLDDRFPDEDILLLNQCRHANTSHTLCTGAANELLYLHPDILVLQLGLADLWPAEGRNCPPPEPEFKNQNPWVSAEHFRENFSHFLDFCSGFPALSVILVNIPRVSEAQYSRYPVALERTLIYNEILHELTALPRVSEIDAFHLFERQGEAAFTSDGIHPTALASLALANELFHEIAALCDPINDSQYEVSI